MPMVDRICKFDGCRALFPAREADVARGWALYCSKSCKAKAQEAKTGANRGHQRLVQRARDNERNPTFDNAHQFDNTEL